MDYATATNLLTRDNVEQARRTLLAMQVVLEHPHRVKDVKITERYRESARQIKDVQRRIDFEFVWWE